jgi:hypothetical protein
VFHCNSNAACLAESLGKSTCPAGGRKAKSFGIYVILGFENRMNESKYCEQLASQESFISYRKEILNNILM